MAEHFRAQIDIDGNASGALASIAAVERALAGLGKSSVAAAKVFPEGTKVGDQFREVTAKTRDFGTELKRLRFQAASAQSAMDFRQVSKGLNTLRNDVAQTSKLLSKDLFGKAARGGYSSAQNDAITRVHKDLQDMDRALNTSAARMGAMASSLDTGFKEVDRAAARTAKSIKDFDKTLQDSGRNSSAFRRRIGEINPEFTRLGRSIGGFRTELNRLNKVPTIDRDYAWEQRAVRAHDNINDAVRQRERIFNDAVLGMTSAEDSVAKSMDRTAASQRKLNQALREAAYSEVGQRHGQNVANQHRLADAIADETRARRDAATATEVHRRASQRWGADSTQAAEAARRSATAQADYASAANAARVANDRLNTSELQKARTQQGIANDIARMQRDLDSQTRRFDAARREQRYQDVIHDTRGPLGEQLAATSRLTDAENDLAEARSRLNRATSTVNTARASYGANSLAEAAAMQTAASAARDYAQAQEQVSRATEMRNRAFMSQGSAARYAMYDAGQYQMLSGVALAAPALLSTLAYGSLESAFSDVQRTVSIDGMGFTGSGAPALNLYDGKSTGSDRAFRGLLNLGTRIPVGYGDIFDMAAKAGSIGATSTKDMMSLVSSVGKFNTVSDTTNAADTMESFGQISNLNVDKNYDRIASSIVNAGVAAAATDDQIIKMTKELSMSAAGANFSTQEIIGLGTAFSSLAIPPERARSVFQNLVTTMSKGMAQTTPEIKNMAGLLGMNVDQVRSLWKSNPTKLFQGLTQALGSMDETRMVGALESIGLEGQRAVPMFQAIAKNVRESGTGMDLITTSLAAAADGYSDISILNDGVAAKTDDIAGQWKLITNEAMTFATQLGGAIASINSAMGELGFMNIIQNILSGLNALMAVEPFGWVVGATASLASLLGILRGIQGASLLLQAGRMALQNMSGINPSAIQAGNLRYLFTGDSNRGDSVRRTPAPVPAPLPQSRVTASPDRVQTRSNLLRNVPDGRAVFLPMMSGAAAAGGALSQVGAAAGTASGGVKALDGAARSAGGGMRAFGTRLGNFFGGGIGLASLGAMAGLAGVGFIADTTNQRATDDAAGLDKFLRDNMIVQFDKEGTFLGMQDMDKTFQAFSDNVGGAMAWTDKGFGPFMSSADYTKILPQLAKRPGGMAQLGAASRYDLRATAGQADLLGPGAFRGKFGMGVGEFQRATDSMGEWGEYLAGLPIDAQVYEFNRLADAMGYNKDNIGGLVKLLGPEFYDAFVGDINSMTQAEIGSDLTLENFQKAGWMGLQFGDNQNKSGGKSLTVPGMSYDSITSQAHRGNVLAEYQGILDATNAVMQAEFAYHNAVSAGTEWIAEYGSVTRDAAGGIDWAIQSNQELYGIQAAMAQSSYDRARSMRDEGASVTEFRNHLESGAAAIQAFGESAKMTQPEIDAMLRDFGLMPDQIVTELITEYLAAGDMSPTELVDVLMNIPEEESVTISADAITDEAVAGLEALGFSIEYNARDKTFTIHGLTDEAREKLEGLVSYDGEKIVFLAEALGMEEIATWIESIEEPKAIHVHGEVSTEGLEELEDLNVGITELDGKNGEAEFLLHIPPDATQAEIEEIMSIIEGATDKDVTFSVEVDVDDPTGWFDRERTDKADADRWEKQREHYERSRPKPNPSPTFDKDYPSLSPGWNDIMNDGTFNYGGQYNWKANENSGRNRSIGKIGTQMASIPINANLDPAIQDALGFSNNLNTGGLIPQIRPPMFANVTPATNAATGWGRAVGHLNPRALMGAINTPAFASSNQWFGFAGRLNPRALMGANNSPAMGSAMGWNSYAGGLFPSPLMTSNPGLAMAASMGWFGFAGGLFPNPRMTSNPALAMAASMGWFGMAQRLRPNPRMTANSSSALSTALGWFSRANRLRPRPIMTATAHTAAAEGALNYAARNRSSTITVHTRNIVSTTSIGGVGRGRYYTGGFTGRGGKYEVAGTVHRGEHVIPKKDVDQSTGLPTIDALGRMMRAQSAPIQMGSMSAAPKGGMDVVELGPASMHKLINGVSSRIELDGKTIANNSSQHYRTNSRRGSR